MCNISGFLDFETVSATPRKQKKIREFFVTNSKSAALEMILNTRKIKIENVENGLCAYRYCYRLHRV